jgi:iron complex outermembrane receptor protein
LQLRTLQYEVDGLLAGPEPIQINDDFLFFNPKAGLTFTLNSTQKLYFSYARAHREPNRTDYENGSPKPESLNDFELGWRGRSPKIQWQANVYWMAYKDQLVLTGALDDVGAPIRQNVGNSRRIGLEIEGKVQWAAHWLWQPNIAFSRNENLDFYFQRDGQLQNLGRTNLAYSPGIVAGNAIIFAPSTRFQVALLTKYVGKQYMGNIDAESSVLEAYNISDLNAVYRWQPKGWIQSVEWSLLLNNLFNVAYVSNGYFYTYDDTWSNPNQIKTIEGAGYYPQAGFHFLTGVTIVF